jgi:hypothetical protein
MAIIHPIFLSELYLSTYADTHWHTSGIDSPELCSNRQHYFSYPHKVEYCYNSRGFRDAEWPEDLANVIWCVGDSFTVGLGSPREHTWPYILQQRLGRRTINLSLDGASNNWIARIGSAILAEFPNAVIVTQWGFLHRRELSAEASLKRGFPEFYKAVADHSWPLCNNLDDFKELPEWIQQEIKQLHNWPDCLTTSENRRAHYVNSTTEEDVVNTQLCMQQLQGNIVHSAIPNWAPPGIDLNYGNIILTNQLDRARDYFHYDILTSTALVDQIIPALALNAKY